MPGARRSGRVLALLRSEARVDVCHTLAQLLQGFVDIDLLAFQRLDALGEFLA